MRRAGIVFTVLGLALTTASAPARGDEEEIRLADCPAAVQATFRRESRGVGVDTVTRESEDGQTTYWADVVIGGKTYGIEVSEDGTLKEISLQVDEDEFRLADCPAAVQKTLREEARGAEIDEVRQEMKFGVTVFTTGVTIAGKSYQIKVAEDGTLTEKALQFEEHEVQLADCPAAVQKTFQLHAQGNNLGEITRQSGIGKRVYQTEVEGMGKLYDVEVAEDGSLISKSLSENN